jgi:hypothetical protein
LTSSSRPRHPLEEKLNAPAEDIMDAVLNGFRAIVDVKGKLAELYMYRSLENLRRAGVVEAVKWHDQDGQADFEIVYRGHTYRLECKNIRSPKRPTDLTRVEMQKTRNARDGTNTRGYRFGDFDLIGVCLFNRTGRWNFLYTTCQEMEPRENDRSCLKVMQAVPESPDARWTEDLKDALDKAADQRESAHRQ